MARETTEANQPATLILNSIREALDESPDNLTLRLVFARSCEDSLAFTEALCVYRGILEKHPSNPAAHLGLARTLFFSGSISEAEVRAQGLTDTYPTFAEGHLFLCRILCGDEYADLERAAKHYGVALSLDPKLAEPALDRDLGPLIERGDDEGGSMAGGAGDHWLSPSGGDAVNSPFEAVEPIEGGGDYEDGGFIDALKHSMDKNGMEVSDFEPPTIDFSDIGGLYDLKEEMRMKIVHPIKNPQLFKAYGINPGGSFLLYGPPGCGKSMVGEALAGEVDAAFYSLGLHQLLDAGAGRAEKQLHEIFHIAKMNAPSVLFLDEVDAIAGRRDSGEHARSTLVNQLLKELDDVAKCPDGVLVVAATSAPWLLDPAFNRAGRFERRICVATPGLAERADIIRVLRNRIPVSDLDTPRIAAATEGFSGAELMSVFESAANSAIAGSIKIGCYQALTTALIIEEAQRLKPAAEQWMAMAREEVKGAQVADSFTDLFGGA